MIETQKLKRIALLPNVVTAFGLSCGLFVIFKTNMVAAGEVNEHILLISTLILLLAAVADLLDGLIARAIHAESEFGGLFDSLADAISFGVAPSVVVLKTLSVPPGTKLSFLITIGALIFCLSGVLRLVRYSVQALAVKTDDNLKSEQRKHFTGLPIPAAAAAILSLNLFLISEEWQLFLPLTHETEIVILSIALILLGYCMISRLKFPSLTTLRVRVRSFRLLFLTVIITVCIFYGILHYFALVFLSLSWGYVVIAWTFAIIRLIAGRKSKTLEAFEPEPETDDFEEE